MSEREDPAATPARFGIVLAPTVSTVEGVSASATVLKDRLARLCGALSNATGLAVAPAELPDYPSLSEAIAKGEVELAWLAPVVALRAMAAGRALPIAMPVRRGLSSFHSALFTQVGSPIQRPTDLVGARAAWVDRKSASGYLVIRAALRAQGVNLEAAFSQESFYGSHEAVVRAVLEGTADVGATYVHHDAGGSGVWRAGWGSENVHVITRVGPIPSDVLAAAIHLPVPQIRRLQQVLTDQTNAEVKAAACALFEADQLILAESEHLKPLEELLDFLEEVSRPWESIIPPPDVRLVERGD